MFNLAEYLREKGFKQKYISKRSGYSGPCPFCPGGNDRFTVWPDQKNGEGRTSCRICGKSEDGIAVVRYIEKCSYKKACEIVGVETGLRQYTNTYTSNRRRKRENDGFYEPYKVGSPGKKWEKKAEELIYKAHQGLIVNPKMLKYLDERGVSGAVVKKYQLGLLHAERKTGTYRARSAWGLPDEIGQSGKPKTSIWFPEGLLIPITYMKKAVGLRIRKRHVKEGEKRYHVVAGSEVPAMIHGKRFDRLLVLETNLDGMALGDIAGDLIGVVSIGGLNMRPHVKLHELLKNAEVVFDCLDFDRFKSEKARKVNASARKWWKDQYGAIRSPVPVGKDVGEAIQQNFPIREWIKVILEDAGIITENSNCENNCKIDSLPAEYDEFIKLMNGLKATIKIYDNYNGLQLYIDNTFVKTRPDEVRSLENIIYGKNRIMNLISQLEDGLYNAELIRQWLIKKI